MNCNCNVENDGGHSCGQEGTGDGYIHGEVMELKSSEFIDSMGIARLCLDVLSTTFDKVKPERRMAIKKRAAELLLDYLNSYELVQVEFEEEDE